MKLSGSVTIFVMALAVVYGYLHSQNRCKYRAREMYMEELKDLAQNYVQSRKDLQKSMMCLCPKAGEEHQVCAMAEEAASPDGGLVFTHPDRSLDFQDTGLRSRIQSPGADSRGRGEEAYRKLSATDDKGALSERDRPDYVINSIPFEKLRDDFRTASRIFGNTARSGLVSGGFPGLPPLVSLAHNLLPMSPPELSGPGDRSGAGSTIEGLLSKLRGAKGGREDEPHDVRDVLGEGAVGEIPRLDVTDVIKTVMGDITPLLDKLKTLDSDELKAARNKVLSEDAKRLELKAFKKAKKVQKSQSGRRCELYAPPDKDIKLTISAQKVVISPEPEGLAVSPFRTLAHADPRYSLKKTETFRKPHFRTDDARNTDMKSLLEKYKFTGDSNTLNTPQPRIGGHKNGVDSHEEPAEKPGTDSKAKQVGPDERPQENAFEQYTEPNIGEATKFVENVKTATDVQSDGQNSGTYPSVDAPAEAVVPTPAPIDVGGDTADKGSQSDQSVEQINKKKKLSVITEASLTKFREPDPICRGARNQFA